MSSRGGSVVGIFERNISLREETLRSQETITPVDMRLCGLLEPYIGVHSPLRCLDFPLSDTCLDGRRRRFHSLRTTQRVGGKVRPNQYVVSGKVTLLSSSLSMGKVRTGRFGDTANDVVRRKSTHF